MAIQVHREDLVKTVIPQSLEHTHTLSLSLSLSLSLLLQSLRLQPWLSPQPFLCRLAAELESVPFGDLYDHVAKSAPSEGAKPLNPPDPAVWLTPITCSPALLRAARVCDTYLK